MGREPFSGIVPFVVECLWCGGRLRLMALIEQPRIVTVDGEMVKS